MKPYLKKKVVRKVAAALFDAGFSCAELRQIGESFVRDLGFQRDLADVVTHLSMVLKPMESGKEPPQLGELSEAQHAWVQQVYELVQKKRMSKRELGELLGALLPEVDEHLDLNTPVRVILAGFARCASPDACKAVEQALQRPMDDPYLKGIMHRSEGKSG